MFAYTMTPKSVNILIDGRMRAVDETHLNYAHVIAALKSITTLGEDKVVAVLRKMINIDTFVARFTQGRVQVSDDAVMFDGAPLSGVLADRLLELLNGGFDVKPLATFLDRVMNNPIQSARDELYLWLERSKMPITADGCFLGYKKVRDDYKSFHDGATDNSIGTKLPYMDDVDTDRYNTCSNGYHFCSHDYLPHFMGSQGRVVVVKVAPEDVRAIPNDYNNAKGRAATYEVVSEVPEDEAAFAFVGQSFTSSCGTYQDDEIGSSFDSTNWYEYEDEEEDENALAEADANEAADEEAAAEDNIRRVWNGYFYEYTTAAELHGDEIAEEAPVTPPTNFYAEETSTPPVEEKPETVKWWHSLLRRKD